MTSYEPMISRAPGLQDSTADLAQKLSAAIQAGEMDEAANLATDLSRIRAKLDISVPQEDIEQRSKEKEFIVKVHLEDRVSAGCSFNLTVKACDTIGDLKRKVMLKHNFPMEVQRWIIGKKIHNDKDKLGQCGIKGPGNTVYLYLVTARSVGLTKQNYEASRQAAADDIRVQHSLHNPNVSPSLLPDLSGNPTLWPQGDLQLQLGSDLPLLCQAFSPVSSVMGELDQTSKQKMSISRGSSFIQEMLQSPMLSTSPLAQPVLPPEPQPQSSSPKPGKSRRSPTPNRGSITPPQSSVTQSNLPQSPGWECPACTYINLPTRPGCEMCSHNRPANYQIPANYQMTLQEREMLEKDQQLERMTREAEERMLQENYNQLIQTDSLDLIPNAEPFTCPICFSDIDVGEGIMLRDCLHMFCRECLQESVRLCEDAILKCPYNDEYSCPSMLQDREIRALVSQDIYNRFLQRGLDQAESQMANAYHCKTTNCRGWCVYEDLVNFFKCQVCNKENCLTCKAIHEGLNCKQYQDDLQIRAANDHAARQTKEMLEKLVADGDAMHCPQCKIIVQKKDGCDWIKCSICKTEICWVTKGPRWGPMGDGDHSGGCRCRLNGRKCHPNCMNCH